jgi:hypothetical protein
MKTTQRFLYNFDGLNKGFLLMPDEVSEVKNYLSNFPEKTLEDAFERISGLNKELVSNVRLEVIYYSKPFQE